MNFKECLKGGVARGALTSDEADILLQRFEELRAGFAKDGNVAGAGLAARDALSAELKAVALEKRRLATLQKNTLEEIEKDLLAYRTASGRTNIVQAALRKLENFGYAGYSSVEGKAKAIVGMAHAELADVIQAFEREVITGRRKEMFRLGAMLQEMHGEAAGDATAREFAHKVQSIFEILRQRFNAAGGAIGKLDGYAMPQAHNARAIVNAGVDKWKAFITPLLNRQKMRDPLTGAVMDDARLNAALDVVYARIVTDGWSERTPSGVVTGAGALAGQRAEHRFLHFKDAKAWQSYADAFGDGDAFAVMFNHIRGMANDIAAMEVLGPNPESTLEYMKQLVKTEKAKAILGEPSQFAAKNAVVAFEKASADYMLDSLWSLVRGGEVVSERMTVGFANVRNVLTSAQLGSAILGALPTDPVFGHMAKKLAGLPTGKTPGVNLVQEFMSTFRGASREDAVQAGLIMEDALYLMGREARYAGSLAGTHSTRFLADRTMALSGLSAWTQARKHTFGIAFQEHVADLVVSGIAWEQIDLRFRLVLEGGGLDAQAWEIMANAELHRIPGGKAILRPSEIAAMDRKVAERYLETILSMTERAVPSGSKTMTAMVTGGAQAGTLPGEVLRSMMQYKSFGLSVLQLQLDAAVREGAMGGGVGAARYLAALGISAILGGAVALQLRALANGKDPQPMDDPKFWLAAAKAGGGFGIFGDFLFSEHGRFGHSFLTDALGPVAGLATDVTDLAGKALRKAADGEAETIPGDVLKLGRRYVPVVSSMFYTRAAWNRIVMDQLQHMIDPDAYQSFHRQMKNLNREYGQEYFWRPGEMGPQRAPEPKNLTYLPIVNPRQ